MEPISRDSQGTVWTGTGAKKYVAQRDMGVGGEGDYFWISTVGCRVRVNLDMTREEATRVRDALTERLAVGQ